MSPRQLQTQTEAFWRQEYEVSDADLDLVTGIILEASSPQPLNQLAASVITSRYQQEKSIATQQATRGDIYRPADRYDVDQRLVFSALDYAIGHVISVRPGQNPKYGSFDVVAVAFEDGTEQEFAMGLEIEHPLNVSPSELVAGEDVMSEEEMVRLFEHAVASKLQEALDDNSDFANFEGMWFLNALLPEIHVGYLNLAEAIIYEAGHPLVASEMVGDMGMDADGSPEAQLFALNKALGQDERFDDVSMGPEQVWFLRDLEPAALFARPAVLEPGFKAEGGELLGITLLDVVDELGDELDDVESLALRPVTDVRYEVSFPYLHAGALPATDHLMRLLPSGVSGHFPITMNDANTGSSFDVWLSVDGKYMCGFDEWFSSVGMCVGGLVTLTPAGDKLTFQITVGASRSRRSDWLRSVAVGTDGLTLQMQRGSVALRCDRNMLIDVPDASAVARFMAQQHVAQTPLPEIVRRSFLELAKLSSRGMVHVKSIYSVANMYRRCGAVPVFEHLTRAACYDPVGDGFWAYDPANQGKTYHTPDEMRERPHSTRGDLVRDQVVQYLGK